MNRARTAGFPRMDTQAPPRYIGCHDCDALFTAPPLKEGERIDCPRCGAHLFSVRRNAVPRAAAFALAAAVFFVIANLFPFLTLKADYRESDMVFAQSVTGLEAAGYPPLASAVAFDLGVVVLVVGSTVLMLVALARQSLRRQRQASAEAATKAET